MIEIKDLKDTPIKYIKYYCDDNGATRIALHFKKGYCSLLYVDRVYVSETDVDDIKEIDIQDKLYLGLITEDEYIDLKDKEEAEILKNEIAEMQDDIDKKIEQLRKSEGEND